LIIIQLSEIPELTGKSGFARGIKPNHQPGQPSSLSAPLPPSKYCEIRRVGVRAQVTKTVHRGRGGNDHHIRQKLNSTGWATAKLSYRYGKDEKDSSLPNFPSLGRILAHDFMFKVL
jgi:hypothetical protein